MNVKKVADKYILPDGSAPKGETTYSDESAKFNECVRHLGTVLAYFNAPRFVSHPLIHEAVEFYNNNSCEKKAEL